ncbi:NADPH-dependent F420 reductase [Rufibacter hautae]|uniref:3-hydroxyisobutyrate dehydrogenase n=1 Tax=Rufibacter hautae TaxID=2595005 RepID=A0A5B6TIQ0_9BACT|nr:NAD(P)-binding domain-containing protein [Rufibacter hautae]KAA3439249.1 3-hydroxyisobutyrate dehydrogenase [Rufibacter hautae]
MAFSPRQSGGAWRGILTINALIIYNMKIGIIGTGAIGSILAKKLSGVGHQVKVTNTRDMATLKEIAANLGAEAATLEEVMKDVEALIFSIPFKAYKDLPKNLLQGVPQEVVIMDTSNYYPLRDGELPGLEGKTESEYISATLGRSVTKVFNNILEHTLQHKGKATGEDGRIAISVAGDNEEHKRVAAELVNQTGFDTVDGGSLAESWRQEPGTPAYCTELNAAELREALARAEKGKAPAARDSIMAKLNNFQVDPIPPHEEIVALNRLASAEGLRR